MGTHVNVAVLPPCDMCGNAVAAVDGRTVFGPWAYMCEACWDRHGVGRLGTGHGKRLGLRKEQHA